MSSLDTTGHVRYASAVEVIAGLAYRRNIRVGMPDDRPDRILYGFWMFEIRTAAVQITALPGEQGVNFDPTVWESDLPADLWPEGVADTKVIWRSDVFAIADAWRRGEASSAQLAAAALIWGYGRVGYGSWRARKIFEYEGTARRLDVALAALRQGRTGPEVLEGAYQAFRKAAVARIRWLGPAFFTKILYFAGYRRGERGLQPLILDRIIASGLPPEAGVRRRYGGWSHKEWFAYLHWAADQAARRGVEPDQVELDLFARQSAILARNAGRERW